MLICLKFIFYICKIAIIDSKGKDCNITTVRVEFTFNSIYCKL